MAIASLLSRSCSFTGGHLLYGETDSEISSEVDSTKPADTMPASSEPSTSSSATNAKSSIDMIFSEPESSESSLPSSSTSTSIETSNINSATFQDFAFQVTASMPIYLCNVTIIGEDVSIQQVVISDSSTGALIQTITPPENNEEFTSSAIYFEDINFNGNIDLSFPRLYRRGKEKKTAHWHSSP